MTDKFAILPSNKSGLDSKESYVVARNRTSFLRVLGDEPKWELMTATASEDHGRIAVCADQRRVVESALRLGAELDTQPRVEKDRVGREYVKICVITRDSGQDDKDFDEEKLRLFRRFFEIYDGYKDPVSRGGHEMRDLYDAIATHEEGGDVYLSDGVWLSSDGSCHDRGR